MAPGHFRGTQPALASPGACSSALRDGLVLEPDAFDDGVTMVSELAANTLHVQRDQPRSRGIAPTPSSGSTCGATASARELVCKVFDTFPGWLRGNVPGRGVGRAPADAISGRGLEVVHELSRAAGAIT